MDSIEQAKLFRQILIWKRLDHMRAVRFSCIEDIGVHKYAVQNSDFFTVPIKNDHLAYFEKLFAERLIEVEWTERNWFVSVEEAIAAHEKEFR